MNDIEVDVSPLPSELIGEAEREGCTWLKALSELIDNAFDEAATRVVITIEPKMITVVDDGTGCPTPEKMFQRGYTTKATRRNTLGRYGIGLKHASIYFCKTVGDTRIVSVHDGKIRVVTANWGDMIARERWAINQPSEHIATPNECAAFGLSECRGTSIQFMQVQRQALSADQLKKAIDDIAFQFFPAIQSGRQIIVSHKNKRLVVAPPTSPEWIESMDRTVHIGKKTARVQVGIVASDKPNPRRGLSYFYLHRVIMPGSAHGCGGYPIAHISGTVELDSSWKLGQNKSEISDDNKHELGEAILSEIEPLLKKASQQTEHILSSQLKTRLEDLVNDQLGRARRSQKKNKSGTVQTKQTPRTVMRAMRVSDIGNVRALGTRPFGRITVEIIDSDSDPMASVDIDANRVTLNRHFEFVKRIAKEENDDALASLICATFLQGQVAAGIEMKSIPGLADVNSQDRFSYGLGKLIGGIVSDREASIEVAAA